MKIIFLLLIAATCRAQSPIILDNVFPGKYDTIKVLMLCADTSKMDCCSEYTPVETWTLRGYEVIEFGEHISYLTIRKKPIKYYVWRSERL